MVFVGNFAVDGPLDSREMLGNGGKWREMLGNGGKCWEMLGNVGKCVVQYGKP
jgi:hypothetical protein